jgi:N6-adenosine-specific RNA methylase IME4
MPLEKTFE